MTPQEAQVFNGTLRIMMIELALHKGEITIEYYKIAVRNELSRQRKMAVELYIENQKGN